MDLQSSHVGRDVLRFALYATSNADGEVHAAANHLNPDRRRKLLEGISYSRRFIISYNIVLLGILLCFTAWHWGGKALRARRRRRRATRLPDAFLEGDDNTIRIDAQDGAKRSARVEEQERGSTSSSSTSSTLEGTSTPPDIRKKQADEQTPLLGHETQDAVSRISYASNRIRSRLMYQPPNIPIVNKVLPSNLTTLVIILFMGLNAFYIFYRVPLEIMMSFIFADRVGLLFVANLPLLYLFGAKNQPLKLLTGYSYEGLNIFHRRLGELMCLLALLHAIFMTVVWYTFLLPVGLDFWRYLSIKVIWLGLLAFIAYETLYLTSLGSFRQRFYELFLVSHVILQAAALILLWFHHHGSRPYVGIALGIFLIDRLIFRTFLKPRTIRADLSVLADRETVLMSTNWQLSPTPSLARRFFAVDVKRGWNPSEHVFLTVPALKKTHIVQAHPFTIASAAPPTPDAHAWLNLVIRAHDGFSRDLLRYAELHSSANVRLDGPYGSMHALSLLQDSDAAVIVAGGSGIAVAFPLVWALLYDSRKDAETAKASKKVCLIWVVHHPSHLDWIGQERLDELREMGLKIVIPATTNVAGRPDMQALVEDAVAGYGGERGVKSGVVVSGPDGMNREVRNACAKLVGKGWDVGVSVEKFGW
ncbi:hypothetical protein H2203_007681 [Taxawa tesnikishii (nom. ined.)]|nr:hypothetical protein H2203_007681 [Dothideales sp. JES 119]